MRWIADSEPERAGILHPELAGGFIGEPGI